MDVFSVISWREIVLMILIVMVVAMVTNGPDNHNRRRW